jgi:hypothetical protein
MPALPRVALLLLPPLLAACASDTPAWAVHHAALEPSATGLSGTQTWEFFSADWASSGSADAFTCTRAQLVTGEVSAPLPGCDGCTAAYDLTIAELDTDCPSPFDEDTAYGTPKAIGLGDIPMDYTDLDPYPGRSVGWYVSVDAVNAEFYGFAYEESLAWAGDVGAPGWASGQRYTLWPAFAWDLRN